MAKCTGPGARIAHRFGEAIFDANKVLSKKNYPPGRHDNSRERKTPEYDIQLHEKQRVKYTYGVLGKQFRNLFKKASRSKGVTDEVFFQLLEGRPNNVVYRLGITPTRTAARRSVSRRHITVDGSVVNISSYSVKPGQVIGVREKPEFMEVIAGALSGFSHSKYLWIEWDQSPMSGKLLHLPERADIPESIKEQLIVESYSR